MEDRQARARFIQEAVRRVMEDLTEAAVERFGESARRRAEATAAFGVPQGWRDYDFIEVLLPLAVPWVRAMIAAYGRDAVEGLVAIRMGGAMRKFGQRASADSDGSVAGRVERALAPIPSDALTIEDRRHDQGDVAFTVTRCRYAELLAQIDARDLGGMLICNHDFTIAEAMGLRLERSRPLISSGLPCDFHYTDVRATND